MVNGLSAKSASGQTGAARSLPIKRQLSQTVPTSDVPIKNPRRRKLKSLFPKPRTTQIRRTDTNRIGNGSNTSESRKSFRVGVVATYKLLTSSRQSPPAWSNKRVCTTTRNNVSKIAPQNSHDVSADGLGRALTC